jgi:hypothetical protein
MGRPRKVGLDPKGPGRLAWTPKAQEGWPGPQRPAFHEVIYAWWSEGVHNPSASSNTVPDLITGTASAAAATATAECSASAFDVVTHLQM